MALLHAILLAGTLAAVSGLIIVVVGGLAETAVENRPAVRHAESRLPVGAQMESRLELREGGLRTELNQLRNALGTARRRRYDLDKALDDARRSALAPVRIVGREDAGQNRFVAWMINRQVQSALSGGKAGASALDPDWAGPQMIEIWADNLSDARRDVQRYYPAPLGYTLLSIQLNNGGKAAPPQGDGPGDDRDGRREHVA